MLVCSFASGFSLAIDMSEACSVYYNELQCSRLIIEGPDRSEIPKTTKFFGCAESVLGKVCLCHIYLLSYNSQPLYQQIKIPECA